MLTRTGSATIASALLCALLLGSCRVQRTMTITSTPPGAQVRLDDVVVGNTPMVVPFIHYGTRRVTFYLDGYLTAAEQVKVSPPWFARFPLDLISEVLIPVGWSDDHPIHMNLRSGVETRSHPALRSVLERAEILRRAGPEGPRPLPPVDAEDLAPPGSAGPRSQP